MNDINVFYDEIINEASEKLKKSKGIIILEHMNPGKRKAFLVHT